MNKRTSSIAAVTLLALSMGISNATAVDPTGTPTATPTATPTNTVTPASVDATPAPSPTPTGVPSSTPTTTETIPVPQPTASKPETDPNCDQYRRDMQDNPPVPGTGGQQPAPPSYNPCATPGPEPTQTTKPVVKPVAPYMEDQCGTEADFLYVGPTATYEISFDGKTWVPIEAGTYLNDLGFVSFEIRQVGTSEAWMYDFTANPCEQGAAPEKKPIRGTKPLVETKVAPEQKVFVQQQAQQHVIQQQHQGQQQSSTTVQQVPVFNSGV